jgi:hypothetical protein
MASAPRKYFKEQDFIQVPLAILKYRVRTG